jgi:23S rRNA (cytosine1962-C5)-methyltransferase
MNSMPALHLKKNREKSLLQGHPWIFSGAIASIDESLTDGDIAAVIDYAGNHHGYGYYNGKTAITVRMLSFSEELVTDGLLRGLIASALDKRTNNPLLAGRDACRLLFSEGDFLPGLIVDRYGGHLVMQILTLGMEKLKENIVRLLEDLLHPESIYERSDHEGRRIEGLAPATGQVRGETPPEIHITEEGLSFKVDVLRGQKTGFFLDQRDNRMLVRSLAQGRTALNLFSYTGAFSMHALAGGALRATSVDSSQGALDMAQRNAALNGFAGRHHCVRADIFHYLREANIDADLIICDPPALVKSRASLDRGCRGYKDLNLQIAKKCPPGTVLLTCSCSRFVDMDLFQKIIFAAFADAGRKASIIGKYSHPCDHPVSLFCPETEYLKAILVWID